ncbi:MAG: hypothetical protein U0359_33735 [Byssovorax sp.]
MKVAVLPVLAMILGCGQSAPPASSTGTSGATTSSATTSSAATSSGSGGAGGSGSGGAGGSGGGCPACGEPVEVGTLKSDKLTEVSGIAASRTTPGVFFVHNDSGDKARFFAISSNGKLLATFDLPAGTEAVDWEDIAIGPCPGGRCVYLADTGDNLKQRVSYTIYRVPEPIDIADAEVTAEAFPFIYPDGAHDCEALFVHPETGVVTLVTKTLGASAVFELPALASPGKAIVAEKRGEIVLPIEPALVTGGDVRADGKGALLRTYANAYVFPIGAGASVADALLGPACPVPLAVEPQGEAIGWLSTGEGFLTTSEGQGASIHLVSCPGW